MILFVLGAGLVTVFVKNDTTTTPTATGPTPSSSVAVTVQPTTSVEASKPAARKNGEKKSADELMPIPHLPASGVGGHPAGYLLVALGGAIALWVRRTART